ncbi:hypothetical protein [Microscilla marina]|uniref:Uncharacterized protein n=1 Tax=Microscilla marina ATCC 23134 TaxID=313606 RepID=A1ZVF1_MICM2|nr:hypothetical protein [Microscilla marina]EAY25649.1 hypothetical protein M23134_07300 [Microscilla marina ATCC 23134]
MKPTNLNPTILKSFKATESFYKHQYPNHKISQEVFTKAFIQGMKEAAKMTPEKFNTIKEEYIMGGKKLENLASKANKNKLDKRSFTRGFVSGFTA